MGGKQSIDKRIANLRHKRGKCTELYLFIKKRYFKPFPDWEEFLLFHYKDGARPFSINFAHSWVDFDAPKEEFIRLIERAISNIQGNFDIPYSIVMIIKGVYGRSVEGSRTLAMGHKELLAGYQQMLTIVTNA